MALRRAARGLLQCTCDGGPVSQTVLLQTAWGAYGDGALDWLTPSARPIKTPILFAPRS